MLSEKNRTAYCSVYGGLELDRLGERIGGVDAGDSVERLVRRTLDEDLLGDGEHQFAARNLQGTLE